MSYELTDAEVERLARVIYEQVDYDAGDVSWEEASADWQPVYRMAARAVATAVLAGVAERERGLREALECITRLGRVCPDFELCQHNLCADSAGAVLIALDALKAIPTPASEDGAG